MATILKADGADSRRDTPQAVAFNFGDVTERAERYLEEVRAQSAQILADAREQAVQIRQQAMRDGRQDAMAAAEQTVQEKVQQQLQFVLPAIQEAVLEVEHERESWLRRWEGEALKLTAAIAERVVRRELQQQPEITIDLLREALHLAAGLGTLTIRLNPRDHEALAAHLQLIVEVMQQLTPAEVIADDAISQGGCRVDTDYGSIDQQIETQLERICAELTPTS